MRKREKPRAAAKGGRRQESGGGAFWIYGYHAVLAALCNPERRILKLYMTGNALQETPQDIWQKHHPERIAPEAMRQVLSGGAVHQGIAAQVQPLPHIGIEAIYPAELKEKNLVVILDQVTDPQNVGAVLRSAAAFGADGVILPVHHSPEESGALAKAASGALETVPLLRVQNIAQTMQELKKHHNFWCVGLEGGAENALNALKDYNRIVLVLGAEGRGLRRLTREHCDVLAAISITDKVESLNVSNAAAIALYQLSRTQAA